VEVEVRIDPLARVHVVTWPRGLDLDAMNTAAAGLLGLHDFAAFCKRREGATTRRTLLDLDWSLAEGGDERRPSSRDRDRGKSRSPRDRDRERPRKDHGERASMEPVAPVEVIVTVARYVPAGRSPVLGSSVRV